MKKQSFLQTAILGLSLTFLIFTAQTAKAQSQSTVSTLPQYAINNNGGLTTFNFRNDNNYPIKIKSVKTANQTGSGTGTFYIWYNTTPVNGQPSMAIPADPSWTEAKSQSSSYSTTQSTVITDINLTVPANTTWGMCIGGFGSPNNPVMSYHTIPTSTQRDTFTTDGVSIIAGQNVSYASIRLNDAPTFYPRGFAGSITFEVPDPCANVTVSVDLGSDTTICEGTALTLDAGNQPNGTRFDWSTGDTTQTTEVSDSGTYTVIADNNGCADTASINVSIDSLPRIDSVSIESQGGGIFDFATVTKHTDSIHWDFGDGQEATGPEANNIYDSNGVYTVIVSAVNDCGSASDTVKINVSDVPVGIETITPNEAKLHLYPNPANNKVTLENNGDNSMKAIIIYNVLGQKVFSGKANKDKYQIDVSSYAAGLYSVKVVFKNGDWVMQKFEVRK